MVDDTLLLEIATTLVERGSVLVLTATMEEADCLAERFRTFFVAEAAKALQKTPQDIRKTLLKSAGLNPSFVSLTNGGWAFFYQADGIDADEAIGDPKAVYWPTKSGEYEKVTYKEWQNPGAKVPFGVRFLHLHDSQKRVPCGIA